MELTFVGGVYIYLTELEEQTRKALELDQERKRAKEEAERLEKERRAAEEAKSAIAKQAADQMKNQEQLVRNLSWIYLREKEKFRQKDEAKLVKLSILDLLESKPKIQVT